MVYKAAPAFRVCYLLLKCLRHQKKESVAVKYILDEYFELYVRFSFSTFVAKCMSTIATNIHILHFRCDRKTEKKKKQNNITTTPRFY